jgi:hypothetical protein
MLLSGSLEQVLSSAQQLFNTLNYLRVPLERDCKSAEKETTPLVIKMPLRSPRPLVKAQNFHAESELSIMITEKHFSVNCVTLHQMQVATWGFSQRENHVKLTLRELHSAYHFQNIHFEKKISLFQT